MLCLNYVSKCKHATVKQPILSVTSCMKRFERSHCFLALYENVYDFKPGMLLAVTWCSHKLCRQILEEAPSNFRGKASMEMPHQSVFLTTRLQTPTVIRVSVINTQDLFLAPKLELSDIWYSVNLNKGKPSFPSDFIKRYIFIASRWMLDKCLRSIPFHSAARGIEEFFKAYLKTKYATTINRSILQVQI